MKKLLSILLTLSMVLAIAATMGLTIAAAPEGTAINTAAEFAAMAADGKYYLAADITIEATYANEFTGTFDGNGKTVTVKAPMFAKTNGATISNFTVKGELGDATTEAVDSYLFVAAVAVIANGKSTFKNIVSNVNFTATQDKSRYGAIAAYSQEGYEITLENCVNNGSVTADIGSGNYAGGVYGWTAKKGNATFKNCVNNGAVTVQGYCAGVVCRASGSEKGSVTLENCINTAKITSTKSYAGGIVAYGEMFHTVTGCINTGDIIANGGKTAGIVANLGNPKADGNHVIKGNVNYGNITNGEKGTGGTAGIIAYVWGSGTAFAVVENNINFGTITAPAFCSQIFAYTNSDKTVVKNNVGAGKVVSEGDTGAVFIGLSSAVIASYTVSGNYQLENDGTKMFSYAKDDKNAANRIAIADRPEGSVTFVSADKLASKETVTALNTAAGATVFELRSGKIALVCSHKYPTVNGACAACGAKPSNTPATGDAAWIYIAVAAVAVLGTAVVAKKKVR